MFEELKIKRLLKKSINSEMYMKLHWKIKRDSRIKSHLINCDPSAIAILPEYEDVSSYVMKNYNLIQYLTKKQLNVCIKSLDLSKIDLTEELFNKLDEFNQNYIFKLFPSVCFSYLKGERKLDVVEGIILSKYYETTANNIYGNPFSDCKNFSDEELKKIVLNLSVEEFVNLFKSYAGENYIIGILSSMDIENLGAIMHLLNAIYENEKFPKDLKDIVDFLTAGNNLSKIIKLPYKFQVSYFLEHFDELSYTKDDKVIESCLLQYEKITADILLKHYEVRNKSLVINLSDEEKEKLFSRDFYNVYHLTNFSDSDFNLNSIMKRKLYSVTDPQKRNYLMNLYVSLTEDQVDKTEYATLYNQRYQISRLLYDENIINNNSVSLLTEYKNTYKRELLIEILANAYGEHVREIFNERPNLNLLNIENFRIFDKKIYNKLGKGFIHHVLNCELNYLNNLIGKLAENEFTLNVFVSYFNCVTTGIENLDLNKITEIMEKFIIHEEFLKKIDLNSISESSKRNLQLLTKDDDRISIGVYSAIDLENYIDFRQRRFIEMVESTSEPERIKDLILAYVLGKSVEKDDVIEELCFSKALVAFNVDNLVRNNEIINDMGLTKEETEILVVLCGLIGVDNVNVLRDTFEKLVNNKLDSLVFENIFDKIRNYYTNDIKNGLLSSHMLESMRKSNVSGVDVVEFDGNNFTLICSVLGLDLSTRNYLGSTKYGERLLNDWLNREDGFNAISTAVVSSDTNIYPVTQNIWSQFKDNIIFIFGNDVDIIGMGASDISYQHNKRARKHGFNFIGEYVGKSISSYGRDMGFSTMDELKDRINKNRKRWEDDNQFESEITISRRKEDIRKHQGGLKRVMPIGMYVVGEITPEQLETARVFNEYYEKNGLGKFKIIKVNPEIYKGNGIIYNNSKKMGDESNGKCI